MNQGVMFRLDSEFKTIGRPIPVGRMVMYRTAYYAVKYRGVRDSDGSVFHGGSVFSFTSASVLEGSRPDKLMICQELSRCLNLSNVVIMGMAEISKQDYNDWIAAHPGEVSYE